MYAEKSTDFMLDLIGIEWVSMWGYIIWNETSSPAEDQEWATSQSRPRNPGVHESFVMPCFKQDSVCSVLINTIYQVENFSPVIANEKI